MALSMGPWYTPMMIRRQALLCAMATWSLNMSAQSDVIGDIVGGADEIVEGKDQRPVPRMDDPRGDRKILVTVRLARPEVTGAAH